MPDQQQLDILKQGVNAWRKEHPEIEPDLNDTDLSRANLSEANLSDADTHGTFFRLANLKGAIITPEQINQAQSPDSLP
jgi:hypothetical protein